MTFAIAITPCVRAEGAEEAITLSFPGATTLTQYWLSSGAPSDSIVNLNGKDLIVGVDLPLPLFQGAQVQGSDVVIPAAGVCTVGFVRVGYTQPVAACSGGL